MHLTDRESYEPYLAFNVIIRNKGGSTALGPKTPGVETALAVIAEEEVLPVRHCKRLGSRVAAVWRMNEGVPGVMVVEVGLGKKLRFLCAGDFQKHLAIANGNGIPGQSNDTFHVVLLVVDRRAKYDDISALGVSEEVSELVDDDVLLMLKRIEHGVAFYLEG